MKIRFYQIEITDVIEPHLNVLRGGIRYGIVYGDARKLEVMEIVSEHIANGGAVTKLLAERADLPNMVALQMWMGKQTELAALLREMYQAAMKVRTEVRAEQTIEIADAAPKTYQDSEGNSRVDAAWVKWNDSRVRARQWILPREDKKWAEPGSVEKTVKHIGDASQPIGLVAMAIRPPLTDEQITALDMGGLQQEITLRVAGN